MALGGGGGVMLASCSGDGKVKLSMVNGTRVHPLKTVHVGGECVALSNFYGVVKAGGRGFINWLARDRAAEERGVGGVLSVYQVSEHTASVARFVPWVGGRGGSMIPPVDAGEEGGVGGVSLMRWYADAGGEEGLWGKFRVLVGKSDNQVCLL